MEFTTHFGLHSQTTRLQGSLREALAYLNPTLTGLSPSLGQVTDAVLIAGLRVGQHFRKQT